MLRVGIHAGPAERASRFNLLSWCDIGYDRLEPVAHYKAVLFQRQLGCSMPVELAAYPRWSASLWDLAARAIVRALQNPSEAPEESLPTVQGRPKGCAFIERMAATIEHVSPDGRFRSSLATAEISQVGRRRGTYIARFDEHTMKRAVTGEFVFRPDVLRSAELLAHACAMRLTGTQSLPPRPTLCIPDVVEMEGLRHVLIHTLVEPARTGFLRWLSAYSEPPTSHPGAPAGIAPEVLYVKFLQEAV